MTTQFLHTKIDGQTITLTGGNLPTNATNILSNGQAVVLPDDSGLDPADYVDLAQVAGELRNLMTVVNAQFVDRAELVEAFTTALVGNEHAFVLSPPGTAKTSVVKSLTKGFNGNVWGTVMNPDLPRDSLVGTIDPQALQSGKWTRRWAGLATCDIGIIDEVWKSSAQNANILLDALEERKVREGDDEVDIPLISALSMSNEIPEDGERAAIYDRFLVRLQIGYLRDAGNFMAMLTASAGGQPIPATVTTQQLRLMGAVAEFLALNAPQDVKDTMQALWRDLGNNGRSVSDRRWRKTLKLAAAYSLLMGETFNATHMIVAKWTLWQDPDQEAEIRELVLSKTDPFMSEVLNLEALLSDLQNRLETVDKTDMAGKAEIASKAGKLKGMAADLKGQASGHQDRISRIADEADQIMNKAVGMF